jgi:LCP family protein required for cell wall assembly
LENETPKTPKNNFKRKFILSCAITFGVLIAAVLVVLGVFMGINELTRAPVIPTHVEIPRLGVSNSYSPEIIAVMERKPLFYTFLLFGLDDGNNADVIIVGALDTVANQSYAISIPRDTLVEVDRRLRKPVAAYAVGRRNGGHDGGVAQMNADIQTLFGFQADFYICIDSKIFEKIIDSVGGVTVDVPFHKIYNDPVQNLQINIPAGTQTLNGQQALHFARYRMGSSGSRTITDYERIKNQQQIISALYEELMSPQTITRVPELLNIYSEHVKTNLTLREKLWFAEQLNRLRGTEIELHTLPTTGTSGSPSWYELPDRDEILELINRTINPFMQEITAEMVNIK